MHIDRLQKDEVVIVLKVKKIVAQVEHGKEEEKLPREAPAYFFAVSSPYKFGCI